MTAVADAVGSGLVKSLARPEANVTGMSFLGTELVGKRLELLKQALPGVTQASAILPLPISGNNAGGGFQLEGRATPAGEEPTAQMRWVNLDYYRTMKIPLLAGRDFTCIKL